VEAHLHTELCAKEESLRIALRFDEAPRTIDDGVLRGVSENLEDVLRWCGNNWLVET